MKHRQKRSRKKVGMTSSGHMTNGPDLDRSPRIGALRSLMLKVDVALHSKISFGPETIGHSR